MLSISINIYPGTDLYRFRLQLETLVHETSDPNNYFHLCVDLLNNWDKNKFEIPNDKFASKFKEHNFSNSTFNHDEIELILAVDGKSKIHEDEFISFCKMNEISNYQIINNSNIKAGVAGMRNFVMQTFKHDYLMFRDDDDFSNSISKLLDQCKELKKMKFGENDKEYLNHLPKYSNIQEMFNYLNKYQKYPTIAILMESMRLKNTWGTVDNPFSKTPTPVDVSTIEMIDRPSYSSMCTKIFSREALKLIYNSTCCQSLEDARSHYLQQLVQHCIWVFDEKRLEEIKDGWKNFKRPTIQWLNRNVLNYQSWQISIPGRKKNIKNDRFHEQVDFEKLNENKNKENIERLNFFINERFVISKCAPNFIYVLPSGSQSGNSWCWCSVIGLLEAYRNANRSVNFTINDLKLLKEIITKTIQTKLIDTNNVVEVRYLPTKFSNYGNELVKYLKEIANYKYIYWFGVVNHPKDWSRFAFLLSKIRELIHKIKIDEKYENSDNIFDQVHHPNTIVEVYVNGEMEKLSLTNSSNKLIGDLNEKNYTDKENKFEKIVGGNPTNKLPKLFWILIAILIIVVIISIISYFIVRNHKKNESIDSGE